MAFSVSAAPTTSAIETAASDIAHRYRLLELLGSGGMGSVYRAFDRLTGQDVALKMVSTPTENLQFKSRSDNDTNLRVLLAREYQALATLRHPHIISVLDYGFDTQGQPFFTMEMIPGAKTIRDAAEGQLLPVKVDLIVQMLQALAYLHRREVIHRDLKPANVLVTNGQVKVLDFGVAVENERTGGVVGTIAFMAPEILQGAAATRASDLFSVGIIAFDLLVGRFPYNTSSIAEMTQSIIYDEPDYTGVSDAIADVLKKLLIKYPEERYTEATEVINDLSIAIGQPLPVETSATRESFLQAAKLVGRDAEVAELRQSLDHAINGKSSSWLLVGESGVGKSRLLDELRTLALVKGALAVTGQASAEGSSPYQIWRMPIRRLILSASLSDQEASVFKALVPDIEMLLQRPILDAPDLEPQAAQARLFTMIVEMLRRQEQPIVILLEDLQWAGTESMALLEHLCQLLAFSIEDNTSSPLKILIIAAYRDDEKVPVYPIMMQTLKLKRLTAEDTAQLSLSILGPSGTPELIQLIQRETEGNAFFLVETLRALAEEVGRLDQVGSRHLPQHVITGGVMQLIQRRLDRVPVNARPLLVVAAAAGRDIDLNILGIIVDQHFSGVELEWWLDECITTAALEIHEGRFRFSHEKLRDAVLNNVPYAERQQIHRKIALAIEAVYENAPEQIAPLAYHWMTTGDVAKAAHYAGLAGEQALTNAAYEDAQVYFIRALTLDTQLDKERTPHERTQAEFRRIVLKRQLGDAYYGTNAFAEARSQLESAAGHLRFTAPRWVLAMEVGLVKEALIQAFHRLVPAFTGSWSRDQFRRNSEAARVYRRLSMVYFMQEEGLRIGYASLRGLNVAESAGVKSEMARLYANVCVSLGIVGLHRRAEDYARRARETAQRANDLSTMAHVLLAVGFYGMSMGQWTQVRDSLSRGIEMSKQLGDKRTQGDGLLSLAFLHLLRGEVRTSLTMMESVYHMDRQTNNVERQLWSLGGQAVDHLQLNAMSETAAILNTMSSLMTEETGRISRIIYNTAMAVFNLQLGEFEQALPLAKQLSHDLLSANNNVLLTMQAFQVVGQLYLTAWEKNTLPDSNDPQSWAEKAQQWLKAMVNFSRRYPIAWTRTLLYQGWAEWLSGKQAAALQTWQKSLALSKRYKMPYEEGLAHYEIARHLPETDPARAAAIQQAQQIFTRIDAGYELGRLNILINGSDAAISDDGFRDSALMV